MLLWNFYEKETLGLRRKKLISKFPDKGWTLGDLNKLLSKIDVTRSSERRRSCSATLKELHDCLKVSNKRCKWMLLVKTNNLAKSQS